MALPKCGSISNGEIIEQHLESELDVDVTLMVVVRTASPPFFSKGEAGERR